MTFNELNSLWGWATHVFSSKNPSKGDWYDACVLLMHVSAASEARIDRFSESDSEADRELWRWLWEESTEKREELLSKSYGCPKELFDKSIKLREETLFEVWLPACLERVKDHKRKLDILDIGFPQKNESKSIATEKGLHRHLIRIWRNVFVRMLPEIRMFGFDVNIYQETYRKMFLK